MIKLTELMNVKLDDLIESEETITLVLDYTSRKKYSLFEQISFVVSIVLFTIGIVLIVLGLIIPRNFRLVNDEINSINVIDAFRYQLIIIGVLFFFVSIIIMVMVSIIRYIKNKK